MRSFLLDGLLNIQERLLDFKKHVPMFSEAESVILVIYNSNYSGISHIVSSGDVSISDDQFDYKAFHDAPCLYTNQNTDIFEIKKIQMTFDYDHGYIFSLRNPVTDALEYVSSLLVFTKTPLPLSAFEAMAIDHLEQFLYHIQTVANNYEKLFYIIDAFTELMSAKDDLLPYHMTNVASWAHKIASRMDLSQRDQMVLYIAALLHDVGKIFITDAIISKPSQLEAEEYQLVKTHSERGEMLIRSILYGMSFFGDVPKIIRHHHEWYNGNGYPDGLAGKAIPLLSRIITVADSIDAMLSVKSYRQAKTVPNIVLEMNGLSGKQYDPEILEAAIDVIENNQKYIEVTTMNFMNFVSNASLLFHLGTYNNRFTINGNLVLNKHNALFIINANEHYPQGFEIKEAYNPMIGFFEAGDFYEFSCQLVSLKQDGLEITGLEYKPQDHFFSLVVNQPMSLSMTAREYPGKLVKLGGDTVLFTLEATHPDFEQNFMKEIMTIHFSQEIQEETKIKSLPFRILKHYRCQGSNVYIGRYLDIKPSQRDAIIRYLFRKQMGYRQDIHDSSGFIVKA